MEKGTIKFEGRVDFEDLMRAYNYKLRFNRWFFNGFLVFFGIMALGALLLAIQEGEFLILVVPIGLIGFFGTLRWIFVRSLRKSARQVAEISEFSTFVCNEEGSLLRPIPHIRTWIGRNSLN